MVLDENAVRDLLGMDDLIPAMARALARLSQGKVAQPTRVMVPVAEHQGFFGIMPAFGGALGAKLVTFYPNNQGVPTPCGDPAFPTRDR
jgi:ornithine cyclodeaminase/alanine dehydrogenase-like protein (mu-crystallin family)